MSPRSSHARVGRIGKHVSLSFVRHPSRIHGSGTSRRKLGRVPRALIVETRNRPSTIRSGATTSGTRVTGRKHRLIALRRIAEIETPGWSITDSRDRVASGVREMKGYQRNVACNIVRARSPGWVITRIAGVEVWE